MSRLTPMMEQYKEIKGQHADTILFFRVGDFYEMFFEDALTASRELNITLTSRDGQKGEEGTPLAGVPHHSVNAYLSKLLDKGYKVAICEQVEDAAQAKGLVRREVTRIITPGTRIDDHLLQQDRNNYLGFLIMDEGNRLGLSFVDISTGELHVFQFDAGAGAQVLDEIYRFQPAELILNERACSQIRGQKRNSLTGFYQFTEGPAPADLPGALAVLEEQFEQQVLRGCGIDTFPAASIAAAAALKYLKNTQRVSLNHINNIKIHSLNDTLFLDAITLNNLEVMETMRTRDKKQSLLGVLDRTRTAMGGRLLRKWLERPLQHGREMEQRWDGVDELKTNQLLREELSALLKDVYDLERLCSRVNLSAVTPRDFLALKKTLQLLPSLQGKLKTSNAMLLQRLKEQIPSFRELVDELEKAIAEDAPLGLKEGGIFKEGYSGEVDELRRLARDSKGWLLELEKEEKERSGIKSLKIRYNKVFGYYIEVTKTNLDLVPPDYIRKQTLVNAERFITEELKEKESIILSAEEKMIRLEYGLFEELRSRLTAYTQPLQQCANVLAALDCLVSLAGVAAMGGYCRPQLSSQPLIQIKDGRHPVVERTMTDPFVPNDFELNQAEKRVLIITGPNMAGKSTYCRSAALLVLMAQAGSFVPAAEMKFMPVEQIFARVGATDDLSSGRSTFMVEMEETASIVNSAAARSLIVLDEIGRGTSTYDGISLARAVLEHLHQTNGSLVLFSTHFHELTEMENELPAVQNLSVSVKETTEGIIFLYKVKPGRADKSYGINVARLANLPPALITRAEEILKKLENSRDANAVATETEGVNTAGPLTALSATSEASTVSGLSSATTSAGPEGKLCLDNGGQLTFFASEPQGEAPLPHEIKVLQELKEMNLIKTTPLQALNKLFSMQSRLQADGSSFVSGQERKR